MKYPVFRAARRVFSFFGYVLDRKRPILSYEDKLKHNFHEFNDLERGRYYAETRGGLSEDECYFFEGEPRLYGQLWVAERKTMTELVMQYKPKLCVEVGTFSGGGSTFFIASALARLGEGLLASSEVLPDFHRVARSFYTNCRPDLAAHVEFLLGGDPGIFLPLIQKHGGIDMLFLDGAEDARQSMAQYHCFLPHMAVGSVLMVHDWSTDKMRLLRPLLDGSKEWKQLFVMGMPESVGFAAFERLA